jgi:hypothetical protein
VWRGSLESGSEMSLDGINHRGVSAFKHFLSGKAISLVLTLGYFFLLTRFLTVGEYSDYVTAIALAEILIGISTLGLDWLAAIKIPQTSATDEIGQATLFRGLLSARITTLTCLFLIAAVFVLLAVNFIGGMRVAMLGLCYALVEGLHRYVATALFDSALQQRTTKRMWVGKASLQLLAVAGLLAGAPSLLTAETAIVVEAIGSLLGMLIAVPALRTILRPVSIKLNWPLLREGMKTFTTHWSLISASYTGSLLSWVGSISTFVVVARVLGGEAAAALVGFCATLTNQVKRYLPTEMFLGVARALIYARFDSHKSATLLEKDLHLYFGIGMATVMLSTLLFILLGEPIIDVLANGKFPDALPLLLLSIGGLAGMVGRRITETAANAVAATSIWSVAATRSLIAVPIACAAFHIAEQPLALVLGWVAVDLLMTTALHFQLARHRAMRAIPAALVLRTLAFLPVFALGYWTVRETHTLLQQVVVSLAFFGLTSALLGRMGFVNLAAARQLFKAAKT